MTTPYTAPKFRTDAFTCPLCHAFTRVDWVNLVYPGPFIATAGHAARTSDFWESTCQHCHSGLIWHAPTRRIAFPRQTQAPPPHPDLPEVLRADYEEARLIANDSPRAACALLRLAIQHLCLHLGESGNDLNADIGALVKKGLPLQLQRALDIVRVVGNNAVHPGRLSPDDVADVSGSLFDLVNQIVEEMITRPKELQGLYERLPEGARAAIEKRDRRSDAEPE